MTIYNIEVIEVKKRVWVILKAVELYIQCSEVRGEGQAGLSR